MDIETLSRKIDQQGIEIKEIKDAIIGSEFTSGKGIIETLKEHDERVKALENIKNKVFWVAIGAGISGGIAIGKLMTFIATAFSH